MSRKLPDGLHAKIAAIQRTIRPVELTDATGDDQFEFFPADGVFEEVRRKLNYYKVGYLVRSLWAEPGPPVRAGVQITLYDVEKPDQELDLEWEGEADPDAKRPYGSARTNALKTFFVAQFRIRPAQKPAESRREARQQAARRQPRLATKDQRAYRIVKPATERGVSMERVLELANGLLPEGQSIEALEQLPAVWVDPLRDAILAEPSRDDEVLPSDGPGKPES